MKTVSVLRPQTTLAVARGAARLLRSANYAVVREMVIANGQRVDLMALSPAGDLLAVEVKSSIEDFRVDRKWANYRDYSDHFAFAVAPEFPQEILPADVGLIVADHYGGEWLRAAPRHALPPARRRSLTIALARLASLRLHAVEDPEGI